MSEKLTRKNIKIREDQDEFLQDSSLNFSKFVRNKLDERMELEENLKTDNTEATASEVTS